MVANVVEPRPPRLPEVIANRIESALIADGIAIGQQLPTEIKLAEQYGVSRTVIREAARILEQRGLVDIRSGRGMTVVELDGTPVSRHYALMLRTVPAAFGQLMDARLLVEVPLTGLAAANRSEADLAELTASVDRVRLHRDNLDVCLTEDLHFHSLISRASGNPMMSLFVDPVNSCLRDSYEPDFAYMSRLESTIDEHQAILDAIQSSDVERATTLAREHLERVKRDGITTHG